MKKNIIVMFVFFSITFAFSQNMPKCAIVLTKDWSTSYGQLYCLEMLDGYKVVYQWPVQIGRNGMGWGISQQTNNLVAKIGNKNDPVKKEGDGKTPAGIFTIVPRVFGYASSFSQNTPYTQVTHDWLGIDDPTSAYYNKIVFVPDVPKKDWSSYEDLLRQDNLYKWFLVVEHNTTPTIIPGGGSCIFMHLWKTPHDSTAGCITMSEDHLLLFISWYKLETANYIIVLPKSTYDDSHDLLGFPLLP